MKSKNLAVTAERVAEARMRLHDIAELLILITDYASPHEILDINRRVREPLISKTLDAALSKLGQGSLEERDDG